MNDLSLKNIPLGGHRGMGCTDQLFHEWRTNTVPVENTVKSILMAFEKGASYVEVDVAMSLDKILFALHNVVPQDHFFTERIPGAVLNTLTFDEIKKFPSGRAQNGTVSTLLEILEIIAAVEPKTCPWGINIEIKGVQGSQQPHEGNLFFDVLSETVRKSRVLEEKILWSSFSLHNVVAMANRMPNSKFGMLFSEKSERAPIYANYQEEFNYQYLPFNEGVLGEVFQVWSREVTSSAGLSFVHPEVMTIADQMIENVAQRRLGINSWALFEKMDSLRAQHYLNLLRECTKRQVPLTVITDYLSDFVIK